MKETRIATRGRRAEIVKRRCRVCFKAGHAYRNRQAINHGRRESETRVESKKRLETRESAKKEQKAHFDEARQRFVQLASIRRQSKVMRRRFVSFSEKKESLSARIIVQARSPNVKYLLIRLNEDGSKHRGDDDLSNEARNEKETRSDGKTRLVSWINSRTRLNALLRLQIHLFALFVTSRELVSAIDRVCLRRREVWQCLAERRLVSKARRVQVALCNEERKEKRVANKSKSRTRDGNGFPFDRCRAKI